VLVPRRIGRASEKWKFGLVTNQAASFAPFNKRLKRNGECLDAFMTLVACACASTNVTRG
jgi:hypothetical protein